MYVLHAVWMAPRWAAMGPAFSERYRFAFGSLRPDCWWWAVPFLAFGLGLTLVQVVAQSVYRRIYAMILLLAIGDRERQ